MSAGEGTAAQDNGADGTRGFLICDANVAAARIFLDRHFGNDGDAHACSYHAEEAAELAAFENDLWMHAGAVAGSNRRIAEAMAVTEEKKRFSAEIFERNRTAGGEFVLPGQGREQPLGEQRGSVKFVAADGKGEDGDIHRTGTEAFQKDGRYFFDDREPNLREFAREGSEPRWQEIRRNRGDHPNTKWAGNGILTLDDVATGGFEFAENGAGAGQEGLAEIGETNGAAKPVE
jgi:hypothetical protein